MSSYFILKKSPPSCIFSSMPTDNPKILITLKADLLTRIDDYRFGNRLDSRSEAIRRLIEEGLKASDPSIQKSKKK